MYLRAKVKPVSFRSTMRTLPKAPLPTTRSSRKWSRLTAVHQCPVLRKSVVGRLTFVSKDDGLAAGVAHSGGSRAAWDVEGKGERSDVVVGLSMLLWMKMQASGHNSCRVKGVSSLLVYVNKCCNERCLREAEETPNGHVQCCIPWRALPVGTR